MRLTLFFDGAAFPNAKDVGGVRGIGVVLQDDRGNKVREISERLPDIGTNNTAEYEALIRGMTEAKELGCDELIIKGDSQLVINQVQGTFRVRVPRLRPLNERVLELAKEFKDVDLRWIPREQNKQADALANRAAEPPKPTANPASAPKREGLGSSPTPREHDILCPKCRKPCTLSMERAADGKERIRQACPDHGFVCWAPMVEPFLTLARKNR